MASNLKFANHATESSADSDATSSEPALDSRFEALVRRAPVGLFETDDHGWCTYANDHICEMYGVGREQLLGKKWIYFVHDDDRTVVLDAWRSDVESGRTSRQEFRICRNDGAVVWVLACAEPVAYSDGAPRRYVGSLTDITPQKLAEAEQRRLNEELEQRVEQRTAELNDNNSILRAEIAQRQAVEESLRASESKWRSLVENVPDYISLIDREGTITFTNRTLPQFAREDVIGSRVYEFLSPAHHERVRGLIDDVFELGKTHTEEVISTGAYGARAWYAVRYGPVWDGDKVVAAVYLATEVTWQKQAEHEAQRRREQLAHMARVTTMSELAAVIAHELNNPLAAIVNNAHGCVNALESKRLNRERFMQALEAILSQANRVGETIRRMQGFLQKRDVARERTSADALVQEALLLAEASIRRHQVTVQTKLGSELPDLFVDRIQIVQVLLNLFRNAVEAMAELQGARELTIEVDVHEGTAVQFCVTDTGPGLPSGFALNVFSPFQSTKPRGLGLGLWISQSIVEAHGGRLRAETLSGGGARFCLDLPSAPPKETP